MKKSMKIFLVTYNSVINAPSYLKIFECRKNLLKNINATNELSFMETSQGKWDMEKLSYGRACMLEKKGKYYEELSNTITTLNDKNKYPLSNANILEAILKVVMGDEEESMTDANNVTSDAFSRAFSL